MTLPPVPPDFEAIAAQDPKRRVHYLDWLIEADKTWRAMEGIVLPRLRAWACRPPATADVIRDRLRTHEEGWALLSEIARSLMTPGDSTDADLVLLRRIQDARDAWAAPGPNVVEAVYSVLDAAADDLARSIAARPREPSRDDRWRSLLVTGHSLAPDLFERITKEEWTDMAELWRGRKPKPGRGVGYSPFAVVSVAVKRAFGVTEDRKGAVRSSKRARKRVQDKEAEKK